MQELGSRSLAFFLFKASNENSVSYMVLLAQRRSTSAILAGDRLYESARREWNIGIMGDVEPKRSSGGRRQDSSSALSRGCRLRRGNRG